MVYGSPLFRLNKIRFRHFDKPIKTTQKKGSSQSQEKQDSSAPCWDRHPSDSAFWRWWSAGRSTSTSPWLPSMRGWSTARASQRSATLQCLEARWKRREKTAPSHWASTWTQLIQSRRPKRLHLLSNQGDVGDRTSEHVPRHRLRVPRKELFGEQVHQRKCEAERHPSNTDASTMLSTCLLLPGSSKDNIINYDPLWSGQNFFL